MKTKMLSLLLILLSAASLLYATMPSVKASANGIAFGPNFVKDYSNPSGGSGITVGDYTDGFHTSAAKCDGLGGSAGRDSRALGYLVSGMPYAENVILDTGNYVYQTSLNCGRPIYAAPYVSIGGPLANQMTWYYVTHTAQSQIYWDSTSGCFVQRSTGAKIKTSGGTCPAATATTDMFVLEAFTDAFGNHIYLMWGTAYPGVMAATFYVTHFITSNPSAYSDGWYVIQWMDGTGVLSNTFPDIGDTWTLLSSGTN